MSKIKTYVFTVGGRLFKIEKISGAYWLYWFYANLPIKQLVADDDISAGVEGGMIAYALIHNK